MMEWPFEGLVTVPALWQHLEGKGTILLKAIYALKSAANTQRYSSHGQDSQAHELGWK